MRGAGSRGDRTRKEAELMTAGEIQPALFTDLFFRESSITIKYVGNFGIFLHVRDHSFFSSEEKRTDTCNKHVYFC